MMYTFYKYVLNLFNNFIKCKIKHLTTSLTDFKSDKNTLLKINDYFLSFSQNLISRHIIIGIKNVKTIILTTFVDIYVRRLVIILIICVTHIKIYRSDNFDVDYKHFTKSHFRLPTCIS